MLIKYTGKAQRFKIMSYRFGADGFHEVQDVSDADAVELLKRNEFEAVLITLAAVVEVVPPVVVPEIQPIPEVQIETPRVATKDEGTASVDEGLTPEPAPRPAVRRGRGRPRASV
jgi:formylmethanofuran dehydrogenase subunit B